MGARTPVLFINSPEFPGADTFIHVLAMRSLDRERFEVHVACSADAEGKPGRGSEVLQGIPDLILRPTYFGPTLAGSSAKKKVRSALQGLKYAAAMVKLAWYVRKNGIRIVHSTDRPRDAVSCALVARLSGAKAVIHLHVVPDSWMRRSVRAAFGKADALIGVSKFVAETIVAAGYVREKTHAVLNAIDFDKWHPERDPVAARQELGLPLEAPVVACIARLFVWKGQRDLVRALPLLRAEFPGLKLLLAGADDKLASDGGKSFTAELQELARELGVFDQVIFTGFRSDVEGILAASDVLVLTSPLEPFGLVFCEAMAMKKPVIGVDKGGAPEIIEQGKSGFLIPKESPDKVAESLAALLRDAALRARMGEYGRAQVAARFTPSRMAKDLEAVYAQLT
ncbi:MAG TPA: glycosyltransferase family 4 protein [Myxococcales bacterium]|nr:glycosyltransferase family 4 protein [Myxococcales bacterium]